MVDWKFYRSLFPVVAEKAYFMTAGAGAIPTPVLNAITKGYERVAMLGGEAFAENLAVMESCREKLAKMINADKENIAFIPNVSYGMNALAHSLQGQTEILMPENEFPSTILPFENAGKPIYKIASTSDIQVKIIESIESKPSQNLSVIASMVSYINGYRLDLDQLANYSDRCDLIVNGTQAIGVFPINVEKQKIQALVCSCYKWMCCGEGISFLYISPEYFKRLKPAFVGWRSVKSSMSFNNARAYYDDARVFELGWDNMISFLGFNAALDLIMEIGVDNISQRVKDLTTKLLTLLKNSNIPVITSANQDHLSGIVLIGPFDNATEVANSLKKYNVFVNPRGNGIRVSLHFYNNMEDIRKLIQALSEVASTKPHKVNQLHEE